MLGLSVAVLYNCNCLLTSWPEFLTHRCTGNRQDAAEVGLYEDTDRIVPELGWYARRCGADPAFPAEGYSTGTGAHAAFLD
jgi:hypothetical protein